MSSALTRGSTMSNPDSGTDREMMGTGPPARHHVRSTVASSIKRTADAKGSHRNNNLQSDDKPTPGSLFAMSKLAGCREIESLCRQRAISDREHSWKWLGEADRWSDLAHREIASRFQKHPMHAGPMAMGPNTIDGDLHK